MFAYQEFEDSLTGIIEDKSISTTAPPAALHKELKKEGFEYKSTFDTSRYGDNLEHNVSFTLANKAVSYNGNTRNLVAVIIRGTDTEEWKGNMDVTGDKYSSYEREHTSFREAAKSLKDELDIYIKNIDNPLFLITGHSRGAAVGNLLAHDLNNVYGSQRVFAYTFATPNNTLNPICYPNIFNFCFEDDFVPQVPLSTDYWNYGKHGITDPKKVAQAALDNPKFKEELDQFVSRSYFNEGRKK